MSAPESRDAAWVRNPTNTKGVLTVYGGEPIPTSVPNAATVRFVY